MGRWGVYTLLSITLTVYLLPSRCTSLTHLQGAPGEEPKQVEEEERERNAEEDRVKQNVVAAVTIALTPSLHFLSRSLSSLHFCAGGALVFFFSSSGLSSPLLDAVLSHCQQMTHEEEEEETRRSCSLFSLIFPSLKKLQGGESRPKQQPKERTHRIYIHL